MLLEHEYFFFFLLLFKVPRTSEGLFVCCFTVVMEKEPSLPLSVDWSYLNKMWPFSCASADPAVQSQTRVPVYILMFCENLIIFLCLDSYISVSLLCRHHLPVNERDARSHVCSLDHWCKKYFNPKTLCSMLSFCLNCVCRNTVYLFFLYIFG